MVHAFDYVFGGKVHGYWVAGAGDLVVETLDGGEGGFEAVPLGGVLFAAGGVCQGIGENGVVGPEGELLEGWAAGEELHIWLALCIQGHIPSSTLTSNTLPTTTSCSGFNVTPGAVLILKFSRLSS